MTRAAEPHRGATARFTGSDVSTTDLLRVRAALSVGAPPAEAFMAVADPALADAVRAVRLGQSLSAVARASGTDGGAHGVAALLRALALAERCGNGGVAAVDAALQAHHDALVDRERLAAKSAQATGTAKLLTALPVAAWLLLIALDRAALGFYTTPLGWACGGGAVLLAAAGQRWARRLVARAASAAAHADPLAERAASFDPIRAAVVALPLALALWWVVHPVAAIVGGAAAATWAGRLPPPPPPSCSTIETIQLLRTVLAAQTGVAVALEHVAAVVAAPVDEQLCGIARRLRSGCGIAEAFAGTGFGEVGAVLEITERWGVTATGPLRLLTESIRARQRGAAETAAERVQLALVFPTTLLTLPAFVLAVVPPLVWTALAG
jgi:Flp pilus assembly protein TadB